MVCVRRDNGSVEQGSIAYLISVVCTALERAFDRVCSVGLLCVCTGGRGVTFWPITALAFPHSPSLPSPTLHSQSYYWLLDALKMYKPVVWEYSRLSVSHTVVSKRKLRTLVEGGVVDGYGPCEL
jgi:tRNA synthetase class I (E and Q)